MPTLKQKYRNPQIGLTGKKAFIDIVSDDESQVEQTLQEDPVYSQFRPIRRKFKRYHFYSGDINFLWSADLMDMRNNASANDDTFYCLVCVDTFTRFLMVAPVKRKTGVNMVAAFASIIKPPHVPKAIFTDNGTEFLAEPVQNYFRLNKINHYTSKDADIKAAHAERAIRTLRERLVRLYAATGSYNWITNIQDIVDRYNHTPNSAHSLKPVEITHENCLQVYKKLYPNGYALPKKPAKFAVGDLVRISKARQTFQKTGQNYSDEIYKIVQVVPRFEVYMYELVSTDDNEKIEGRFYAEELVKVQLPSDNVYTVERIVATKRDKRGKKYYLLKYLGYSDAHNTWEPEENVGSIGTL